MGKGTLATTLRCTGLALIVLGAFVLLPAAAEGQGCTAGFHGVSIFKQCVSPKNRCATDADCSDSDACNGIEQCATEENPGSNVVECTITLQNPTVHCDNITLLDASDAILNATGSGASSSSIQITGVSTGVVSGTCTAGTDLGGATTCTIAPGGTVNFLANYYTTVPTDPSTLNDQATVNVQDTCSGSPTGCSGTPNSVQFTASTNTVSGCSPGTPLVCNDGNACTTDSCDPATGCVTAPVDCNDGLFCTDDSCDTVTGCQHTPHVCNDDLNCTTDTCNEANDVCDFTPVVCKQDANLCNTEACDPADGVCKSGPDTVCPDDSNLCNGPEACVPATGQCASGPPLNCDDGLFCTDDSCDPATGCTHTAHVCNDNNLCTTDTCNEDANTCDFTAVVCASDGNLCNGPETCDPKTGGCVSGPPLNCDDSLFCTDDSCVPETGCAHTTHDCADKDNCTTDTCNEANDICDHTPVVCQQDSNLCTLEACDPTDGQCKSGAPTTCTDDGNLCNGPETCNPTTGGCVSGPPLDCNDGLFCTDDSCDPATGCAHATHDCDDADECTIDTCNEDQNRCDHAPSTDPACNPVGGRMTGGGSIFTKAGGRVTHGFELHCDPEVGPNNLEINWGGGNHFHLENLLTAICTDDPAIAPRPPSADFDTYNGTGTGSCNGVEGASITFVLTDAGEPGKKDFASFEITGCPDGLTLSVSGNLNKGNQQAHKN
jgi:slime mold repeat-containing protein